MLSIKDFNAQANVDFDLVRRKVILDIAGRVIKKTPVDEGGARGGWQSTLHAKATNDVQRKAQDAINEAVATVGGLDAETVMFLTNLMPYIEKLEFGGYPKKPKKGKGKTTGGFSTQAPAGMLRITLAEFEGIVSVSVKGTKFGGR